jgi:hypothetical protein
MVVKYRMSELKSCPFCGGTEINITCDDFGWGRFKIRVQAWWAQCQGDHCYALQQASTEAKLIDRWNGRANET